MDVGSLTAQIELEDNLTHVLHKMEDTVKEFAHEFDLSFKGLAIGTGIAAAAVGTIGAAIVALGNRGADVNDVASTFEHFSGSIENAHATLEGLRKGTMDTVDDMDLMRSSSKLLAGGVQLTADQFNTLGKAAFVLQNQGLGPTKDMLNLVSQALLTGRTRTLEMTIGKIDLTKAEKDYAASLGVDKLTRIQKVEADRIAILEALNKKVQEAGVQQKDFGEIMESAVVAIKNWGDDLASAVAASPHVMAAVNAIGDAISDAFGGDSTRLLNTFVQYINKFADLVTSYGPSIIKTFADISHTVIGFGSYVISTFSPVVKEVWSGLTALAEGVKAGIQWVVDRWNALPTWAQAVIKNVGLATVAVYGLQMALEATHKKILEMSAGGGGGGAENSLITAAASANVISGLRDLVAVVSSAGPKIITQLGGIGMAIKTFYLLGSFAQGGGIVGVLAGIGGVLQGIGAAASSAIAAFAVPAAIIVGVTALAAAVWQVVGAIKGLIEYKGSWASFFTQQDTDNWVRRMLPDSLKDRIDTVFKSVKPPAAPILVQTGADQHVNITQGALSDLDTHAADNIKRTEGASAAAQEYADKLEKMIQSFKDAAFESRLFTDTFNALTPAQRANVDIQEKLVAGIDKLLQSHQKLTPQMREFYQSTIDSNQATVAQERALLDHSNVTQESVQRMKDLGMSEKDIAFQYGVSTQALTLKLAAMQKEQQISDALAHFNHALVDQAAADADRRQKAETAASFKIGAAQEELDDLIRQQTLTTTDYEIAQIKRVEAQNVATFSASGASAGQIQDYTDLQKKLSKSKTDALLVDSKALADASTKNLQQIADKARATYDTALAHSDQFTPRAIQNFKDLADGAQAALDGIDWKSLSDRSIPRLQAVADEARKTYEFAVAHSEMFRDSAIKHFKQIADAAQREADGVKSAWEHVGTAFDDISTILDAIPGKFAEIGAMAARTGSAVLDHLASGDVLGAVVAGIAGGVSIIAKLIGGPTEYQKRMRAAVTETKNLQDQLVKAHGNMQHLINDADLVGINIKEAFNWKDPAAFQKVVDDLNDKTNLLNDAMQEYGFTWQDLGEKARTAKLADLFDDLFKKTDILKTAGIDYHEILVRQAKDYSDLVQQAIRTGTEIPESMKGVLQDLVDMGELVDENGDKFTDLSKVQWAKTMTQGFDDVTTAVKELTAAILGTAGAIGQVSGSVIHVKTVYDDQGPDVPATEPVYAAQGARILPWQPRGTDTVPAMLTPGETVIPPGQSDRPVIINATFKTQNNEVLAKQVVKTLVRQGL